MDCYEQIEFDGMKSYIYNLEQNAFESDKRIVDLMNKVSSLTDQLEYLTDQVEDLTSDVKTIIKIGRGDLKK